MASMARRQFFSQAAASTLLSGLCQRLPIPEVGSANCLLGPAAHVRADVRADVKFSPEIEPWVRLMEETPREDVVQALAKPVAAGQLSYRQFLAALFLAGVRNIQPRPAVGFKFHAVLVVNSAHLASLDAPDAQKWLPMFWALDSFKNSQARDVHEGNWTMAAVDETKLPPLAQAVPRFRESLDTWNEEMADVATAALARTASAGQIFDLYAEFAARDFRSIGHKVIYLANCYRSLEAIGWQHAEPVLRSLSYALLNHVGEPNPATSDLAADRDGRLNAVLATQLRQDWMVGVPSPEATTELLQALRQATSEEASRLVFDQLQRGVAVGSLYDALFGFAAELTMRQPAIVPLHAVTTTNALHYVFRKVRSHQTQAFLILQNAAFLVHFRQEAGRRGALADRSLEALQPEPPAAEGSAEEAASQIFQSLGGDAPLAARQTLGYLQSSHSVYPLFHHARQLIFLKGNDSHDYKYSSAVLEDYFHLSPAWRDRYLAAALFKMRHASEPTTGLIQRILQAVG
jgi:hypothetical protein